MDNGFVVELNADIAEVAGSVPAGNVFVDGLSVGDVGHVVIRDRQLLARDGILLVVVTIDKQSGQLVAGPDIVTRGFVYAAEAGALLDETKDRVRLPWTPERSHQPRLELPQQEDPRHRQPVSLRPDQASPHGAARRDGNLITELRITWLSSDNS